VDPEHGKLNEPVLRFTALLRAFKYKVPTTLLPFDFGGAATENTLGQYPLSAPSVFNFYLPDYEPQGVIGTSGLVGPEFQILNAVYGISTPNLFYNLIYTTAGSFSLDLTPQTALATGAMIDNIDLLLTHGMMSSATRAQITTAVDSITAAMVPSGSTLALTKVRQAIYLTVISPDCAVLK
jgi:hypothetical protein